MRLGLVKTYLILFILTEAIGWTQAQPDLSASSRTASPGQEELSRRQAIEASLVLLENRQNRLPLDRLDTLKIAALSVGESPLPAFQRMLSRYTKVDPFHLPDSSDPEKIISLKKELSSYNLIIAGITEPSDIEPLYDYLTREKKSVLVLFAEASLLTKINLAEKPEALLLALQDGLLNQELSAQLIFGGIGTTGRLSGNIGEFYPAGSGISIEKPIRLKYTIPEELGLDGTRLSNGIDSIVNNALAKEAFPGCNVLVAKEGKVIFSKVYGYHTYDKIDPVREDDLYDLASVTKISGGLPGIMKLYDNGLIDPDEKVSVYFPEWRNRLFHRSDKEEITLRELLSHQSGLTPSIPFWKKTMKEGSLSPKYYSITKDNRYLLYVAPDIWLKSNFIDYINKEIRKSPLTTRGKYVYSDLPLLIASQIVTRITGIPFQEYVDQEFYQPLGATTVTYLPLNKFPRERIIPTENDQLYRKIQLQGSVHDESSATMGGLSGNAGLFASANDLAKLMQLYLQEGSYGGKQYLKKETVTEFTKVQFPQNGNRRGMGFDKPLLNNREVTPEESYPTKNASPESFGHSGYTGTFVWIDPKCQLVYIFLSNRVFPTRENNRISEMNVRTDILKILYENFYQEQAEESPR